MSRSGVAVSPECINKYNALKMKTKTAEPPLQYVIYGLNSTKTEIIVLATGDKEDGAGPEAAYENFLAELPEQGCRWAVYDFHYKKEGADRDKIVFFAWAPDTAPIREKMVFSSSKEALRRSLTGIGIEIQGTDFSEVSYETVLDKADRGH